MGTGVARTVKTEQYMDRFLPVAILTQSQVRKIILVKKVICINSIISKISGPLRNYLK